MNPTSLMKSAVLVAALCTASACSKHDERQAAPTATSTGSSASGSASESVKSPTSETDHITVLAHHVKPKPSDPVRLNFERFKVVKADFDPQKVEGGKATIELDLSSFHTNSDERDEHLKSQTYLDVGKFATATITIDNVKQKAGNTFSADATVAAHGNTKTYPVTFDVVDRKPDSIKIKAQQSFTRLDFGVGTDPAQNAEEQVGTDLTIEMVLTIPKT
jgi:polyisoprenoid-binding protein YceI